jgi:hypothetical protein
VPTISALPAAVDLAVYAGDDFRFDVTVLDGDGLPADLTGMTASAQIRPTRDSDITLADFDATIEGNVIHLHLDHDQSIKLTPRSVWDVQIAGSDITTLAGGNVTTTGEVTRP